MGVVGLLFGSFLALLSLIIQAKSVLPWKSYLSRKEEELLSNNEKHGVMNAPLFWPFTITVNCCPGATPWGITTFAVWAVATCCGPVPAGGAATAVAATGCAVTAGWAMTGCAVAPVTTGSATTGGAFSSDILGIAAMCR